MMDMEFDASGNLMVVDVDQARITVVDPSGNLVETHRVPGATQIMPGTFHPGHWTVMPESSARDDTLWVSRAREDPIYLATPAALGSPKSLAAEGWATNLADGGAVVHFRWSSKIVVLDSSGRVRTIFDGIEPLSFPEVVQDVEPPPRMNATSMRVTRMDPKAVTATLTLSVHASRIYVFFAGATDHAWRMVDTYRMDGGYLGTYLLPHRARDAVVLSNGQLATLETQLIPTVRIWKLDELP